MLKHHVSTSNVLERVDPQVIARDSTIALAGTVAVLALGFSTKSLLARSLSPADLGLLLAAQALVALALALAQLGLSDAVVRFVGVYAGFRLAQAKGVLQSALRLTVITTGVLAIGLVIGAGHVATILYREPALGVALGCLALSIPLTSLGDMIGAAYRGIGQTWVKIVCVDLLRAMLVVLGAGTMILAERASVLATAGCYLFSAAATALLLAALYLRQAKWRVPPSNFPAGTLLRYSLPLFSSALLAGSLLGNGIPLLLASLAGPQSTAYYSLALALQPFVYLPSSAVEVAALPLWAGVSVLGSPQVMQNSFATATRWSFILASLLLAPLFLTPVPVISLLFGAGYSAAAPIVQITALATIFGVAVGPNEGMLRAHGDTRSIFVARVLSGVVAILSAPPMITVWAHLGAAVSWSINCLVGNGLLTLLLYRRHGIHPIDVYFLKALGASAACFAVVGVAQAYTTMGWEKVLASTVAYPVLLVVFLFCLRAFPSQDERLLHVAIKRIAASLGYRKGT